MLKSEMIEIFNQDLQNEINLFFGAGFSVYAKNKNKENLPTGQELCIQLKKKYLVSGDDLQEVTSIIKARFPGELEKFLKEKFTVDEYDPEYKNILKLNCNNIFTVNVDDLIYKIYEDNSSFSLRDVTIRGEPSSPEIIRYIPLHGSILNNQKMPFSAIDMATGHLQYENTLFNRLSIQCEECPTVFIGTSMKDNDVLAAINRACSNSRNKKNFWIISNNIEKTEYYESLGFKPITGDVKDFLKHIKELQNQKKITQRQNSISRYSVPTIAPYFRNIDDFYCGNQPEWIDVLGGCLYKISTFHNVLEKIYKNENILLLGTPSSGKSTLLMQLACELKGKQKIYLTSPTKEIALYIVNLIKKERQKLTIFIDDFVNDVDALRVFQEEKNIQIIATDLIYFYETVSHKIKKENFSKIIIDNISKKDASNLFNTIPLNLKKTTYFRFIDNDTIFEFVEKNIKNSSLKERFSRLFSDLELNDPELLKILLAICYMKDCRLPMSMNMIISFSKKPILDTVASIGKLRNLIVDIDPSSVKYKENQEFFEIRSKILKETILNNASIDLMKEVLIQFHESISPINIVDYYIFKRRGYDSDYIYKYFKNIEEGKLFYMNAMQKDNSPYLRQQFSLYLSKQKNFTDAFFWIQKAISSSFFGDFSLLNTQAVIMFNANFEASRKNKEAKEELVKSLRILKNCYESDRRKAYHVYIFSEQLASYVRLHGLKEKEILSMLDDAEKWLLEEEGTKNRNTHLKEIRELKSSLGY